MVDKNPYENDDVEVPNFGEVEEKGADPIFNMDTTGVVPETDAYTTEEEAESSSKVAIVVLIVFLVLFLVGTISGWIFGITKSNEVNTIKEEASALSVKLNSQITELNTKVASLEAELPPAKSSGSSTTTTPTDSGNTQTPSNSNTTAIAKYSMQDGVSVRTGAGSTFGYVSYDKLPNDVKDYVVYDKATGAVTTRNTVIPIYETKTNGSQNWGRIADNAWICLDYGTKQ